MFVKANNKETIKAPHYWFFLIWFQRTMGQYCGKSVHGTMSSLMRWQQSDWYGLQEEAGHLGVKQLYNLLSLMWRGVWCANELFRSTAFLLHTRIKVHRCTDLYFISDWVKYRVERQNKSNVCANGCAVLWDWYSKTFTWFTMVFNFTGVSSVYSTVCSGRDNKKKYQSSASLAFVRGIQRGTVNSPHKGPVMQTMTPFDDIIVQILQNWTASPRAMVTLSRRQ